MTKTVLITGSSRGIGRATAIYFANEGWNVVATMRHPDNREEELFREKNIDFVYLDVLDASSIANAVSYAVNKFDGLDVVVNNAGYGLLGPFEACTREQIEKEYYTNVLGVMAVTREAAHVMRRQRDGVIINISSLAGRAAFPFYSVYNSTKWAVEGFSESLYLELRPFNVKVKLVEPGIIKTDFYGCSQVLSTDDNLKEYDELLNRAMKNMKDIVSRGSDPVVVARTIFKAANDKSWRLRYPVGAGARKVLILRRLLPERIFDGMMARVALKKGRN